MEFVRQIIDSSLLDKIALPQSLKNKKVEIIILPINEEKKDTEQERTIDSFVGILAKYKNPELIPIEKDAWAEAMVEKHGNS